MRLSAGVEWALHCCVVLASAERPVPVARLATLHDLSPTYLAKQLQLLSAGGLVTSTQGRAGGYVLTRPTAEISVLQVVEAIDGSGSTFRCTEIRQRGPLSAPPEACTRPCAIARAMQAADEAWRAALAGVTLADLARDVRDDYEFDVPTAIREWLGGATEAEAASARAGDIAGAGVAVKGGSDGSGPR